MPSIRPPQARIGLLLFWPFSPLAVPPSPSRRYGKTPDLLDSWKASVLAGDQLSPRTLQTLRRCDPEGL